VKNPVICYTEFEDYTAGEIANDLPVGGAYCEQKLGRWVDEAQYHILSFLGNGWGTAPLRFPDELAIGFTKLVAGHEGVVTWDVPIQKTGLIPDEFLCQLKAIGKAVRP